MGQRIGTANINDYYQLWQTFKDNFAKSTPIDLNETEAEKENG